MNNVFNGLESIKENLNSTFDEFEIEIEKELELQALNYVDEGDVIELDDIMGPSYGSQSESSIEVSNRGGLRFVNIDFTGDQFEVNQSEYEEIKVAIDNIIKGESNEVVEEAIDTISKYGERALKVVFSFARKFDLDDDYVYNDLKELLNRICLRNLKARDTIVAVLIGANSKPHIRLAMVAAGEVRERNAVSYICENLKDVDLFDIAFDALLDIRDISSIESLLDSIDETEDRNEERRGFIMNRTKYFVDFGKDVIPSVLRRYNNSEPWNKSVYGKLLGEFEEDIIPYLQAYIEDEVDAKKLDGLYRLLGRLDSDKVADILVDSYRQGRNKKSAIIGLGHVKSDNAVELQKEILRDGSENSEILETVMTSLAFVTSKYDKEEVADLLKRYINSSDTRMKIHAIFAMARMDYSEYLDKYMKFLASDNVYERKAAARLITKFRNHQITEICKRCISMDQWEAMYVLNALTRRKTFEQKVGEYLLELLEKSSYLLKIEIYHIIGNTANTKNEILPADVLFRELDRSDNNSEKAVLNEIISKMRKVKVLPNYMA